MPKLTKFKVLRRVDAYATYVAEVEAESADEAAELARKNEDKYDWQNEEVNTFDARSYTTLDEDDNEIESTTVGDL